MNNLIISLVVVPLLGAGVCSIGKILSNVSICKISAFISLMASVAVLLFIRPHLFEVGEFVFTTGGWPSVVGIAFGIDIPVWIVSALVLLICFSGLLFACAENSYSPMFYFTFLIMVAGMQGVILTRDIFNLFVFFEILAVASYILIAYFQKSHSVLAAFRYLIIGSAAMMFYLIGVFIIYQNTGSLSIAAIAQMNETTGFSPALAMAITALVIGIGVRTAFVPFHIWLPEAHAYAPHPVSAVLSGVMIKVSFISLWRIIDQVNSSEVLSIFLWIGVASAFLASLWALCETDAKKILAFSSVSQMGYIVAALGMGSTLSRTAALYHVVNHGIFKCLLFLSIGVVIWSTGVRNVRKLSGTLFALPATASLFLIGAMAISGLPPFNGYISKKLILDAASVTPLPQAILWVSGILTLSAYIKLSGIFRGKRGGISESQIGPVPILSYTPMILLGTLCLALGLAPSFWIRLFTISPLIGASVDFVVPNFYSLKSIAELLVIVFAGIVVYKFSNTVTGLKISQLIRMKKPGLNGALCFLMAGFVVITLIMWNNQ